MQFNFTKMHGLGNDFVVIDAINQTINLSIEDAQFIADRHLGIGCDQILLVESSDQHNADFRYRIYNADGSEVEHCGNGARCFARFVRDQGLTDKTEIPVLTAKGHMILYAQENHHVKVDMGAPILIPDEIPFMRPHLANQYTLTLDSGESIELGAVSMGNPHAVIVVNDVQSAPVEQLGSTIEQHPDFPQRVNVGFMEVVNPDEINLRVFERGAGETMACGTGACAAVVSGIQRGLLNTKVTVNVTGGTLYIEWAGNNQSVFMTGPTANVYTGNMTL